MKRLTGEQIRQGRYAKRMTLAALAKTIGVSAQKLSDVEHSRSFLSDNQYACVEITLCVKPVVSWRECEGFGPDYDAAVKDALERRRRAGFGDVDEKLLVERHVIEPWRSSSDMFGESYHHRHYILLRRL